MPPLQEVDPSVVDRLFGAVRCVLLTNKTERQRTFIAGHIASVSGIFCFSRAEFEATVV